jgi:hypothetical protein
METKICNKCKKEKEICDYGKSGNSKDGLSRICKKCNNERGKQYVKENYEKVLETQRKWRRENQERVRERSYKWVKNNRDKANEMKRNWLFKNPEKRKQYRENYKPRKNEQKKERKETDLIYYLVDRVRSRLRKYLITNNITKKNKTFDIVGCTPEFLKEHLETQFKEGMNWENRNKWHIDHITPLSSAKTEEELYKLCHYTNLQPLWAEDNLKKSNKIV